MGRVETNRVEGGCGVVALIDVSIASWGLKMLLPSIIGMNRRAVSEEVTLAHTRH